MRYPFQLAEVLEQYVERSGYTPGQLSRLSGIPQATIVNWLEGRVKKPRHWEDLLKLAQVLGLNIVEATTLLQITGHPSVEDLMGLADDGKKDLLASWTGTTQQGRQAPFQAITQLPYFVGRKQELQAIKSALLSGDHAGICSLHGLGGVGKTTLAARVAYLLRPHFPDGVLWASVDKTAPLLILSAFAAAYDCDVSQYSDIGSRSQVVRTLLAHKRTLIVLDNVSNSEEISLLLPPSGSCAVLITTRHQDLSVTGGAHRFVIGPFDRDRGESLDLFARLLGEEQIEEDGAMLTEIAELLGQLPLAIAIVASRLAYEPGWSARQFLQRLRREKGRMGELTYGDQNVRLSFNLSYEALTPAQQHFFAALSVFGGEDFSVEAVAHVTQLANEETHDRLRRLYNLSLVQQERPERYRLHPLLRDYAREKLGDDKFLGRMVEYFVRYVETHEEDYKALNQENDNIQMALRTALEQRMEPELVRGIQAFFGYLEKNRLYTIAEPLLHLAHQVTRQQNDRKGLVRTSHHLGIIQMDKYGNLAQAKTYFQEGLSLARQIGSSIDVSAILGSFGSLAEQCGDFTQAKEYYQEGLETSRQAGNNCAIPPFLCKLGRLAVFDGEYSQAAAYFREGLKGARKANQQATTITLLANLGTVVDRQGDAKEAEIHYREGLSLAQEIGHTVFTGFLLYKLGRLSAQRCEYDRAEEYYREGLKVAQEVDDKDKTSLLLASLGVLQRERGEYEQAETYLQEALPLARETEYRLHIQIELGELYLKQQRLDTASAIFDESLALADKNDFKEYRAEANFGLARVAATKGDELKASRLGRQSLADFTAIGHRKTAEVKEWLIGNCFGNAFPKQTAK